MERLTIGREVRRAQAPAGASPRPREEERSFGAWMGRVATGALAGVAAVAPLLPGGRLVELAAGSLRSLTQKAPPQLAGGGESQIDQMWQMQDDNQLMNLQYLQLQQKMQADHRQFSAMSNLMKARHDTAKAAISNMHV